MLSVTPCRGPGFRVIGISTEPPGGIGSVGALAVVQPQLGTRREITTGWSVMLNTVTLAVFEIVKNQPGY